MDRIITNEQLILLTTILAHDRAIDVVNLEQPHNLIDIYQLNEDFQETETYTNEFQKIFNDNYNYYHNKLIEFSKSI